MPRLVILIALLLTPLLVSAQQSTLSKAELSPSSADSATIHEIKGLLAKENAKELARCRKFNSLLSDDPAENFYAEKIDVRIDGLPAYVAGPRGSCFCGAANCIVAILIPQEGTFETIAKRVAQEVKVLPFVSHGFHDIDFRMHGSAFDSTHFLCRFDGHRYVNRKCEEWSYSEDDGIGNIKELKEPRITPCSH
jgi:hypothetical protein